MNACFGLRVVCRLPNGPAKSWVDALRLPSTWRVCRENTTRVLEKKKAEKENMRHEVDKINQHDRLRRDERRLHCRAAQLDEARTKVLHYAGSGVCLPCCRPCTGPRSLCVCCSNID